MFDIIQSCAQCSATKTKVTDNLADGLCSDCTLRVAAIRRYADSNIPVEYWNLSMDQFEGAPKLKKQYEILSSNLDEAYRRGTSIIFGGSHGLGKQLSLDTELPTPDGFITLSNLKEGDALFDEAGNVCHVTKLHPINISPESYEIEFDDGSKVEACADHLWVTLTRNDRRFKKSGSVKNTKQILETLRFKNGVRNVANHSIPCAKPVKYEKKILPIDPYILGCQLAGSVNERDENSIPSTYLTASIEQREALLQGLLDTAGHAYAGNRINFSSHMQALTEQVATLVRSLGIKCNVNNRKNLYTVTFSAQPTRTEHRFIINVKPIPSKPMRCITVDSPSHLFLITRHFIPTHNTTVMTNVLKKASLKGYHCTYTTLNDIVAVMTSRDEEDKYIARKELLSVDFLVIDEFDDRYVATNNAADLFGRTLEGVLRNRAQNTLPTFLCTNSPNIIEAFTGPIKDSLESLLKGYTKSVIAIGEDFRKSKKNQ